MPLLLRLPFPPLAQPLPGPVEAAFDGAFGAIQDGGAFGVAEAVEATEDEDGAEFLRQGKEAAVEFGEVGVAHRGLVGGGALAGQVLGIERHELAAACSRAGPQPVAAEIQRDLEQPGAEAGAGAVAGQCGVGAEEGVLAGFAGVTGVAEVVEAEVIDALLVALDEGAEGVRAAALRGLDQRGFRGLVRGLVRGRDERQ